MILHPSIYVLLLFFLYAGLLKEGILFILCLFLHECGHLILLRFYSSCSYKIHLSLFGAELETSTFHLSKEKEMIVNLAGVTVNFFIVLFLYLFLKQTKTIQMLIRYNLLLIGFNLLPIYPLDGFRIINTLLIGIPFRKRIQITQNISNLFLFFFFLYTIYVQSLAFFIIFFVLVYKNMKHKQCYHQLYLHHLFLKFQKRNTCIKT